MGIVLQPLLWIYNMYFQWYVFTVEGTTIYNLFTT